MLWTSPLVLLLFPVCMVQALNPPTDRGTSFKRFTMGTLVVRTCPIEGSTLLLFLSPSVLVRATPTTRTVPPIVLTLSVRQALKGTLIIMSVCRMVPIIDPLRHTTRLSATGSAAIPFVTMPDVELFMSTILTFVWLMSEVTAQLHEASTETPLFCRPTLDKWRAAIPCSLLSTHVTTT